MTESDIEQLKAIKTFPSLVKYLRDELDWPIETDDFDNLTFDYNPEELGIDPEVAAKIDEIKQLRPLSSNQPWGIFFIKFEPKQLPVVVLRRILSQLVIKKRASADKSKQAAWNLNDLLFISNYGEEDQRQLTFAHFIQDEEGKSLPTLKVLGWDNEDTILHLAHTDTALKEKLHWPKDDRNIDEWRKQWSSVFEIRHREVITTAKELAERLASLAIKIRKRANRVLAIETDRGSLRKLHKAFQTALIHDLSMDDFADMYAQTITYGLLAARVSRPMGIISDNISDMVPITNPFLKEILGTFLTAGGRKGKIDFDELGIQDVVDLLNSQDTHIEAILRDFGNRTRQEDPIIHFYEDFLAQYDKKKKVERGVFYTPQPVVSYIVRSVHEILQKEFGLEDGLAATTSWGEMTKRNRDIKIPEGVSSDEPFVQILDPATGTATFLVETIDVIHKTMVAKWTKLGKNTDEITKLWNEYVPKHLLPRLYGFELMMAPYAIANMKLGLKLYETGYRFISEERSNIYITNSLESPTESNQLKLYSEALAKEAYAVSTVKKNKKFTVIIGNPPYSGHSANKGIWAKQLVEEYKKDYPELNKPAQAKWLQDDYVKFIRLGQKNIDNSLQGVLGFITNHAYIDNPTFRGMRQSLMKTFTDIYMYDLHGNANKRETTKDGGVDENVFDIKQGVAISLMIKESSIIKTVKVHHGNLQDTRENKYKNLLDNSILSVKWEIIEPNSPQYLFVSQNSERLLEYNQFWNIADIMNQNGDPAPGIVTTHDQFAISWNNDDAITKVNTFLKTQSENDARKLFRLCNQSQWNYKQAKRELSDGGWKTNILPILYRPFDIRCTIYDSNVAVHHRKRVMDHMLTGNNLGFILPRRVEITGSWMHILVTKNIVDHVAVSLKTVDYLFPIYLNKKFIDVKKRQTRISQPAPNIQNSDKHSLNLNTDFIGNIEILLNVKMINEKEGNLKSSIGPEDIFNYIYAILFSPSYRIRYTEFLKSDFPRLPLTSNLVLFSNLVNFGHELVTLHLMESPKLGKHITKYNGHGNPKVEKVTFSQESVWLDKGQTQGFKGVPQKVWEFQIGAYQVCEKWLKDRKGRKLSAKDIEHYHRIIVAINETIRLMAEIDKVIDKHGGWPGAFITDPEIMKKFKEETNPSHSESLKSVKSLDKFD